MSPLAVTISGNVASENPIKCEITDLSGVIVVESVEKLYLEKDDVDDEQKKKCKCAVNHQRTCNDADSWTLSFESPDCWTLSFESSDCWTRDAEPPGFWTRDAEPPGFWTQHSEFISSIPKEVPWYLDDGTGRVYVVGARFATGFVLPAERSKFDESGQTLVGKTFDNFRDKKILGLERIEQVLPVGTSLTVVGEASKDDDGTVRIQRPPEGPFYVSCKTIDEHIAHFEGSARWFKYISLGLTTIGASLMVKSAIGS